MNEVENTVEGDIPFEGFNAIVETLTGSNVGDIIEQFMSWSKMNEKSNME